MQFKKIRKNNRKEILIGGLVILGIVSAITLVTTKAKYKVTQNIPLVNGTINYKTYDFKVMAMYQSEDGINYTEINEMPSTGYVINEDKTYCTTDNQTEVKGKIKTIDGNHVISNLNKGDKCYLYFDKELSPITIPNIISANNPKDTTPDFSQVATTDEGAYAVSDGMYGGTLYYWRGAVTNNYVSFAGFCWRIVRINGDGSMRLIYDGISCHANGTKTTDSLIRPTSGTIAYQYNASYSQSNYVGWTYSGTSQRTISGTSSNAKNQTEKWFDVNITGTNLSKVDTSAKFCNDRDARSDDTWAINPSSPFYYEEYANRANGTPTLSCPSGDVYITKVGAIIASEVIFAGGTSADNASFYLYNGQNYWTMSPFYWSGSYAYVFIMNYYGHLNSTNVRDAGVCLRPVINLKADTTFATGGTGTQSNPYIVS